MEWEKIIKSPRSMWTRGGPIPTPIPDGYIEERANEMIRNLVKQIGDESSKKYYMEGKTTYGPSAGYIPVENDRVKKEMTQAYNAVEKLIRTAIAVKHEGVGGTNFTEEQLRRSRNK